MLYALPTWYDTKNPEKATLLDVILTSSAKLSLVQMTVLPLFDYGDTIYRSACKGALDHLDVLYHSAIRFATNAPYRTHHGDLYSLANWPSLETRRNIHWLMLVYKTLL